MEKPDEHCFAAEHEASLRTEKAQWCVMKMALHLLPQTRGPRAVMGGAPGTSHLGHMLWNACPVLLRTVQVINKKEDPRDCDSPEESELGRRSGRWWSWMGFGDRKRASGLQWFGLVYQISPFIVAVAPYLCELFSVGEMILTCL